MAGGKRAIDILMSKKHTNFTSWMRPCMTAQVYNQENEKRQNNQTPISPEPLKVSWISPQPLFNIHWYGDLVASQAKS